MREPIALAVEAGLGSGVLHPVAVPFGFPFSAGLPVTGPAVTVLRGAFGLATAGVPRVDRLGAPTAFLFPFPGAVFAFSVLAGVVVELQVVTERFAAAVAGMVTAVGGFWFAPP